MGINFINDSPYDTLFVQSIPAIYDGGGIGMSGIVIPDEGNYAFAESNYWLVNPVAPGEFAFLVPSAQRDNIPTVESSQTRMRTSTIPATVFIILLLTVPIMSTSEVLVTIPIRQRLPFSPVQTETSA